MICEFVFIVIVNNEPQYVGTFDSCKHGELYQTLYLDKELESRCLPKDFVVLPPNFQHKCISMKNFKGINYVKRK